MQKNAQDFFVTGRAILEGLAIRDRPVIRGNPDGRGTPVFTAGLTGFTGSSFSIVKVASGGPILPRSRVAS